MRAAYALALGLAACRSTPDPGEPPDPRSALESSARPSTEAAAPAVSAAVPPQPAACAAPCLDIEKCVAGKCEPNCPAGEVYIPATGAKGFTMGDGDPGTENQRHTVVLTKPFCIDQTEVTTAAYRECFEKHGCERPQLGDINANMRELYRGQRETHPINLVNHRSATHYCKHLGKSLPTEAQWEWAASGGDDRRYPWGDEDPTCENELADFTPGGSPQTDPAGDHGCRGGGTSPIRSHPKGRTVWPAGAIYDLGGNVWEWTSDCLVPYPAEKVTDPHPVDHPGLVKGCKVWALRGGGWNRSKHGLQVSYRAGSKFTYRVPGLGFRCVRNPDPARPEVLYRD